MASYIVWAAAAKADSPVAATYRTGTVIRGAAAAALARVGVGGGQAHHGRHRRAGVSRRDEDGGAATGGADEDDPFDVQGARVRHRRQHVGGRLTAGAALRAALAGEVEREDAVAGGGLLAGPGQPGAGVGGGLRCEDEHGAAGAEQQAGEEPAGARERHLLVVEVGVGTAPVGRAGCRLLLWFRRPGRRARRRGGLGCRRGGRLIAAAGEQDDDEQAEPDALHAGLTADTYRGLQWWRMSSRHAE
ncbi:hypothetical protein GCM10027610_067540 [Dactylosporangium cerinum]